VFPVRWKLDFYIIGRILRTIVTQKTPNQLASFRLRNYSLSTASPSLKHSTSTRRNRGQFLGAFNTEPPKYSASHYLPQFCPLSLISSGVSLVRAIEELLGRKSSGSCREIKNTAVGIRHADHVALSIRKSWH
jgi:hypothetical protein